MDDGTRAAWALSEEVVDWLRENYGQFEFWAERDLIWTLRTRLRVMISERGMPFSVLSDFGMIKYEPSHLRPEFRAQPEKLPVVFWGADGVAKDVARIRQFVGAGVARVAFAMFLDEGRHFRGRTPHPGSAWRDWDASEPGTLSPAVLWSQWPPRSVSETSA